MESFRTISVGSLPAGSSVTFQKSSFFLRNGKHAAFPTPSEILATSVAQTPSNGLFTAAPSTLAFENLGLLVKFGREPVVNIAEGQCLWMIQPAVPGIPVPEIYGWTQEGDLTFLFMELVPGITLKSMWCSLSHSERTQICTELRNMVRDMRRLRQEAGQSFIGTSIELLMKWSVADYLEDSSIAIRSTM
ncbi:hypothetical protein IF1G_09260 [Cordyceps javanica]|uniref:Aminoglycoside phosphotransferase domain-containing protein n=1 Tax=Cordyceps javanica TaxID=43265 RepID=A0A545URT7_9HYPO|nr:hypothetical protein IF1G_09260 [Cordyceps javanica]